MARDPLGKMPKRMEMLRAYRPRPDVEKCEVVLRKVLRLFGEGIRESLERTSGYYLSRTNGKFQNSNLTEKARKKASKLISHNNWAERPFAVVKALAHQCPSMSLSHLSCLAHARVNGTYRSPTAEHVNSKKRKKRTMERPGAAIMAHPAVKTAVAKLCCVRSASLGGVVKMRRELRDIDIRAAWAHSAKHHEDKIAENERLATARATKLNGQVETVLITTTEELNGTLAEMNTGQTRKALAAQINKRTGLLQRTHPLNAVPLEHRAAKIPAAGACHKIKMSPSDDRNKDEHLKALLELLTQCDGARSGETGDCKAPRVTRKLVSVSSEHASAHSVAVQSRLQVSQLEKAQTEEDPLAAQLHEDYTGKLLIDYDYEGETYRVFYVRWRERTKE